MTSRDPLVSDGFSILLLLVCTRFVPAIPAENTEYFSKNTCRQRGPSLSFRVIPVPFPGAVVHGNTFRNQSISRTWRREFLPQLLEPSWFVDGFLGRVPVRAIPLSTLTVRAEEKRTHRKGTE
jgi:hypothetical protein